MFTKKYVREVLNQMCAPYMAIPLSDEYVQKIYDDFVKIRNGEAVEQTLAPDGGDSAANSVYSRPECIYNYCPYTMPTILCADVGHCLHPAAGKA